MVLFHSDLQLFVHVPGIQTAMIFPYETELINYILFPLKLFSYEKIFICWQFLVH